MPRQRIPTFCAAAGDPDVLAECLNGDKSGSKTLEAFWMRGFDYLRLPKFFKD